MRNSVLRMLRIFLTSGAKLAALLLAVSVISFALVSASPVDPVQQYLLSLGTAVSPEQRAEIEAYWGVNEPPVQRCLSWLAGLLRGNLGESAIYRRPVADIIGERFVNSLALMLCAWILSAVIGFGLGCLMGMHRDRLPDRVLKKLCYLLSSVPSFWLGLVLLLVFAVGLRWFPVGFSSPIGILSEDVTVGERLHHLILPAFTLSLMSFVNIALHTRQKLIDVLNSDYVLILMAAGGFLILRMDAVISLLPFVFGLMLLGGCAGKLQTAVDLRRVGSGMWLASLLMAAVSLALGIVLLCQPFESAMVLTRFIGVAITLEGAENLAALPIFDRQIQDFYDRNDDIERR